MGLLSTKWNMAKANTDNSVDREAQARDAAARLNRSLFTVSRCNRVLWQARSEQELLQSICQVLAETAGLRLAWIGYCEDDAAKTVRPMARAGSGLDYLERVKFSWDNSDTGQGPVGDAIRTGRLCWIDDIRKDPGFSHGRIEAVAHGFMSCVALPLIADVGSHRRLDLRGTLALYADAFDKNEIEQHSDLATYLTCAVARLRSNLVDDVTSGVTAFRAREDRKRAEEALRERARLLDLTHDSIFVRNMNDVITFWNRGAEELYGWNSEQAAGQVTHRLMQTVFPAPLEAIKAELLRSGRWDGELIHTKRDGTRVVVASRWALQRDEQGNPIAILETNNDITERKHAEGALRDMQTNLAHVMRISTLGELTASISHEVNQPLGATVTNAQAALRFLGDQTVDLNEVRHILNDIMKDGNRASEVIRRVRALANKTDIEKVQLDVNDVVKEIIALVQREIDNHQVSLRMELAPALPMILGDRVQLQQVIINLVMNGIEAMQSVTDRPRELVIRSHRDEPRRVLVSVTDSGVGISAENADRLFNAFFTTKSSGMGVGLSISRSIVEAHGGRLWTTANVPHGATFQLALPVNTDTAS